MLQIIALLVAISTPWARPNVAGEYSMPLETWTACPPCDVSAEKQEARACKIEFPITRSLGLTLDDILASDYAPLYLPWEAHW